MNIVEIMKNEIIKRSNEFEGQTKGTKDEYNIYREHIQYVYNYAVMLSENEDVDLEVLKLSALLHDISMTDRTLDRAKHNEYGAEIAEHLLKQYNYPNDKIALVKKCILNHSSKRKDFRTTKEEEILVTADGLSHFDSINNLYSLAYNVIGLNEFDSIKFVQEKLTKDYEEIPDNIKPLIEEKYRQIMSAQSISDLSVESSKKL